MILNKEIAGDMVTDPSDARTILNLFSKNFTELDIVCDVQPNSKITAYQIYARLDITL
jgi:hypothetical protein